MNNQGFYISPEGRQHLNLSKRANEVIELDMMRFNNDYDLKNKSGFINKIIENYHDTFPLSEGVALKQIYLMKKAIKSDNLGDRVTNKVIDVFTDEMMKNAIQEFSATQEYGINFKLKLNNATAAILESIATASYFEAFAPRSGLGFFIKAIIESYVRLSREEREYVYYQDLIEKINKSIADDSLIAYKEDGKPEQIRAFQIGYLEESSNLQVAYFLNNNGKFDQTFSAMRLKELALFQPTFLKKTGVPTGCPAGMHWPKQEHLIHKNEETEFEVRFSAKGLDLFFHEEDNLTIIGKPSKEDENIYTFKTTEDKLFLNLFKYGPDIEIISPKSAQHNFKALYKFAYEKFEKDDAKQ